MNEVHIDWEEFVAKYKTQELKIDVDMNKSHALMKSRFGPKEWRIAIPILTWVSLLAVPSAIILFFFIKWWICIIILVTAFMMMNAIRKESANAVVKNAVKNPEFYSHAVISKTMKLYL